MQYSSLAIPFVVFLFITLTTGKLLQRKEGSFPLLSEKAPFAFLIFIGVHALIIITLQLIKHLCFYRWQIFYLEPLTNPFSAPFPLSLLVTEIWLSVILFLTMIEQAFRYYPVESSLLWISHLPALSLLMYILFIPAPCYTTLLLLIFPGYNVLQRVMRERKYKYRCGKCNGKMKHTGKCPHCGIINS